MGASELTELVPMTDDRVGPSATAPEREMLRGFLDFHRATLAMKCDGLSDEQLRRASMPPSSLSLLGLVRHMAEVERTWFRKVINGEDIPLVWSPDNDYQVAYDASQSSRSEAFAAWQALMPGVTFEEVADSSAADIRVGFGDFDTASTTASAE